MSKALYNLLVEYEIEQKLQKMADDRVVICTCEGISADLWDNYTFGKVVTILGIKP